jgi:hypothetical protein
MPSAFDLPLAKPAREASRSLTIYKNSQATLGLSKFPLMQGSL